MSRLLRLKWLVVDDSCASLEPTDVLSRNLLLVVAMYRAGTDLGVADLVNHR